MSQLLKLPFTLLALISITLSSPLTNASSPAPALAPEIDDPDLSPLSYSPSPSYDDDGLSPEPQYPNEEEGDFSPIYPPSPLAYAPDIDEEYPYDAENPSPSPSPIYFDILAPEADDDDNNDGFYSSPNEAPSPTESVYSDVMDPQVGATPPVMPFNYSAEDDDTDDSSYEEEYDGELNKKNRAVIGFVMGAICLVGLGAVVYKKRKNDQRLDHQMYVQLSKKDNDV